MIKKELNSKQKGGQNEGSLPKINTNNQTKLITSTSLKPK